jgi:hypothetical protein
MDNRENRAGQPRQIEESILANPGMTENEAALHSIGPHDIGVQDGEYRVDVARVERAIRTSENVLGAHLGYYPYLHQYQSFAVQSVTTPGRFSRYL